MSWLNRVFPKNIYDKFFKIFFILFLFKFLFFDFVWALSTSFESYLIVETYLNKILVVLILMLPYIFFKQKILTILIAFAIDFFLISNLMYFRIYFCEIPLSSYTTAGNLLDFKASVLDALRWYNIVLPVSTIVCIFLTKGEKYKIKATIKEKLYYCGMCLFIGLISFGLIQSKGGFVRAYESLMENNRQTCAVPMYTLFGALAYDTIEEHYHITPTDIKQIDTFLETKPKYTALPDSIGERTNVILIIMESFESWVLEKNVEGKEVTPCLNKLLKDTTTLYLPKLLSQVKGARSIDAQLLINAGMLPINSGAYSLKFPLNKYYTLTKAIKQKHNAKSYLCTVDKDATWNQRIIAQSFGFDTIIARECFVLDEKVSPRKKLGDRSFFRQCAEKMQKGEIWPNGENAFIQFVTYSGHNPYILQKELHSIEFSNNLPKRVRDYMIMANYTDGAVGKFIEYLKTRPDYDKTLIVITGDHEGFTRERKPLVAKAACKGLVSEKQFTPLIIVNSPIAGRYSKVIGQIDVYPTLLNLMHLDDYQWKGLGQSIFDKDKKAIAVGPHNNFENEEMGDNTQTINDLFQAWKVSDLMIKSDYFKINTK